MGTHQGQSLFTELKERHFEGITSMRVNQFKNDRFTAKHNRVIFADCYCGCGSNHQETDRIIDGSPLRLLNAVISETGKNTTKAQLFREKVTVEFYFSDINPVATQALKGVVDDRYSSDIVRNVSIETKSAADAIIGDLADAASEPRTYVFLLLDPNGPKDFPRYETEEIIRKSSKSIDVSPYLSATTINRCINSRNKAGRDFCWLDGVNDFVDGYVNPLLQNRRGGWIRVPRPNDPQKWIMLFTTETLEPKYDWGKEGFLDVRSPHGRLAIDMLAGKPCQQEMTIDK